ncbi:MAG: UDP-N-acetylmuramoyl-tripeptide--D-alanyl-D-alanine ligase [Rhodobacteraceae bacterium]|nr:UDP-N-acetylmuramoyl-tripeptide--D-alanyl-D-alanine ligase [Paracoccaceae bacterium]
MILWSAQQAALATGGRAVGGWAVTGVSIDTRTLQTGDLFVALKAARDGHDFVADALAAGAGAALVSRVPDGVDDTAPLLIVADVQAALEDLGRAARARTKAKVIAVTGSVGKTSTKEMLRHMLGACGKTHASVASYNNHWGVPLTLARMPADTEFAVIEIGMNHPDEIAPLAKMAAPDVAMVTTVAEVHLEAFDDINGIALEKASIIDGLVPNGVAIMNADTPCTKVIETYTKDVTTRWFGAAAAEASLSDVQVKGAETHAVLQLEGATYPVTIGTAGRHFAMNALGALLAVGYLGADRRTAVTGLAAWNPLGGRGARQKLKIYSGTLDLIDDAYNANPTSLHAAMQVLAEADAPRKIAFLGDMKELGEKEHDFHREVAHWPCTDAIDIIHTVGPLMKSLHDVLPDGKRGQHFGDSAAMAAQAAHLVQAGDAVLLKASLSTNMRKVVDALQELGHPPMDNKGP